MIESPETSSCVPSLWTGAGYYEIDRTNALSLQDDPAATSSALALTTFGGTEELYEALTGVADPAMVTGETGCTGPTPAFVGCPSFRSAARQGTTLIGIWTGGVTVVGRNDLVDAVRESGSFRSDGVTPLVYDGMDAAVVPLVTSGIDEVLSSGTVRVTVSASDDPSGAAVVPLVTSGIDEVLSSGTVRVTVSGSDDPSDGVDASQSLDHVEVNTTGAACVAGPTEDGDGDGVDDAFVAVPPTSRVCFDVVPRTNVSVAATSSPQVYPVRVTIPVDGTPAETQVLSFIIPSQA